MALLEMVMPKMGESIMEGTVLIWLKQEGDTIEADESVLEVATDKVDTKVPAIHAGILKEILVKEGDVVDVGAPIAKIETAAGDFTPAAPAPKTTSEPAKETASSSSNESAAVLEKPAGGRLYSPLVMNIAPEEGISMSELERVPGTGREDRVTRKDILVYVKNRPAAGSAAAAQTTSAPAPHGAPKPMPVSISGDDEIIEMDLMRKMIAERMVDSKRISPHSLKPMYQMLLHGETR
jgi:2-oxoglutarate dehydrogenase E2 component (dihydrolipoamide succinyltransferase)